MAKKTKMTAFRLAPELSEAMHEMKATKGVPISTQIDFALRDWLARQGIRVKAERGSSRKRS